MTILMMIYILFLRAIQRLHGRDIVEAVCSLIPSPVDYLWAFSLPLMSLAYLILRRLMFKKVCDRNYNN